ncbi:UNVERIFIED_CONTAM: Ectonucleotide pyrophosphatase/phosphodiesterase family member 3 [Sesamum radiatum]|uniref:Ectonucleotide pyrophosphatase/phosphodiesterase family member 3 n=1 Tax=Sesamum radiatum TaxID=300843 RepID=A0AAW2KN79_SESRA
MGSGSVSILTPKEKNPMPISTKEEDELANSSSAALLSFNKDYSSSDSLPKWVTVSLVISTSIALCAAIAFGFLFFSASKSSSSSIKVDSTPEVSRKLVKLKSPVVLLISSDGFRFGYQFKVDTPNIHRLIKNGTEAEVGLIPVFPTLTFPNHYSIVTGLYPAYHGIINNYFTDPETERVDTVLKYFDLPSDEIPSFMTLYFEDPDHQGHKVGPDDPQITEAVAGIDKMMGRLIRGLEERGVFEDVNIIMVGDHGMVGTCDKKLIFLDDLAKWIEIPEEWVQSYSPLLAIRPPPGYSSKDVVAKMNEGLKSGRVNNGLVDEGFTVEQKRSRRQECGGAHGYDNAFFSMRSIFIAHGPQFARGRKVPSFENIQIYNLVTTILNIQGASNNGTTSFPQSILLPSR